MRQFRKALAHWGIVEYGILVTVWGGLSAPLFLYGWGWFSLLSLPLFLAAIISATALVELLMAAAPPLRRDSTQLIEFFTTKNELGLHGTLSFVDGVPRATWTSSDSFGKSTDDGTLSEGSFRAIWSQARHFRELQQFRVRGASSELDFNSHSIVSIVFTDSGQTVSSTYAIPHDCDSAEVSGWLDLILASSLEAQSEFALAP